MRSRDKLYMPQGDQSLRLQLIEAQEKIGHQLEELNRRFAASVGYPSPDNRALVETLEEQLRGLTQALADLDDNDALRPARPEREPE